LTSATWTNLSSAITATGTSTSYTDTTASQAKQRFYIIKANN
jgi:hypothetical protein